MGYVSMSRLRCPGCANPAPPGISRSHSETRPMSAEVPRHPAYRRAAGRAADPDGDSVITEILLLTEQFGWPVFPCGAHKRPLTENGFKDATRDLEQIKAWSVEHPGCLWGVPTGAASGLFVLDIDVDPAKGIDGAEALDTIVAQIGPLPATGEAITPRGGRHIYFLQSREGVTS